MSDVSLVHYDPNKDIIVTSDTSNLGLGDVILHKESKRQVKSIAYASKTLLPPEKGYSQTEKEVLGIILAVKRFHKFIHGRFFASNGPSTVIVYCWFQKFLIQRCGIIILRWSSIRQRGLVMQMAYPA